MEFVFFLASSWCFLDELVLCFCLWNLFSSFWKVLGVFLVSMFDAFVCGICVLHSGRFFVFYWCLWKKLFISSSKPSFAFLQNSEQQWHQANRFRKEKKKIKYELFELGLDGSEHGSGGETKILLRHRQRRVRSLTTFRGQASDG